MQGIQGSYGFLEDDGLPETVFLKDEVGKCETIDELRQQILPMLMTQQQMVAAGIDSILMNNHFKKSQFAEMCGVSRVSLDKWLNGVIPRSREKFIMIGLAAGFNREEMNRWLQRYGRYPQLYPKSLDDCICIFALDHPDITVPDESQASPDKSYSSLKRFRYIHERVKNLISSESGASGAALSSVPAMPESGMMNPEDDSTSYFSERLSQVNSCDELETFILRHAQEFSRAYRKFYAYVNEFYRINYENDSSSSSRYKLSEVQGWSSSLRQTVYKIRQKTWYPSRDRIISLGLHLSMTHEQIDQCLELAHMEPLCAKNLYESAVIFILDDAELEDKLERKSENFDPDELFRYTRDQLIKLNLPGSEDIIADLEEHDDE